MAKRERDPLLLPEEAADQLGVKPKTLEQWRYLGKGPDYIKVGRKYVRYPQSAIDAFIEEHTVQVRDPAAWAPHPPGRLAGLAAGPAPRVGATACGEPLLQRPDAGLQLVEAVLAAGGGAPGLPAAAALGLRPVGVVTDPLEQLLGVDPE